MATRRFIWRVFLYSGPGKTGPDSSILPDHPRSNNVRDTLLEVKEHSPGRYIFPADPFFDIMSLSKGKIRVT